MKNDQPGIKELTERPVAFVSFTGNYMGNPQIFQNLFDKLCGWAGPNGLISPETVFLSSYQDDPQTTPPDELKLELCMSISNDVEVDGDIQKKNSAWREIRFNTCRDSGAGEIWRRMECDS